MEKRKWYLAGPFFNPVQKALMQEIEVTFIDAGMPFFSPRLCDENSKPGGQLSDEDAESIFQRNWEQIEDKQCVRMLAVTEYRLPAGQELVLAENLSEGVSAIKSKALSLPDAGTVWEMGAAFALGIPVYMYCGHDTKTNIMLSRGTQGIIRSCKNLARFLKGDMSALDTFKGGHI